MVGCETCKFWGTRALFHDQLTGEMVVLGECLELVKFDSPVFTTAGFYCHRYEKDSGKSPEGGK